MVKAKHREGCKSENDPNPNAVAAMKSCDGECSTCDACRYEFADMKPLRDYDAPPFSRDQTPRRFCELCAGGSFIATAENYPNQVSLEGILRAVGYCANAILEELRK
jgi:hypothetical protein